MPFEGKGMEPYFGRSLTFGTSKLVYKRGKIYLHIPVTKEVEETSVHDVHQVVGVDMGINFIMTSYDNIRSNENSCSKSEVLLPTEH
jgi:putative transposase